MDGAKTPGETGSAPHSLANIQQLPDIAKLPITSNQFMDGTLSSLEIVQAIKASGETVTVFKR